MPHDGARRSPIKKSIQARERGEENLAKVDLLRPLSHGIRTAGLMFDSFKYVTNHWENDYLLGHGRELLSLMTELAGLPFHDGRVSPAPGLFFVSMTA